MGVLCEERKFMLVRACVHILDTQCSTNNASIKTFAKMYSYLLVMWFSYASAQKYHLDTKNFTITDALPSSRSFEERAYPFSVAVPPLPSQPPAPPPSSQVEHIFKPAGAVYQYPSHSQPYYGGQNPNLVYGQPNPNPPVYGGQISQTQNSYGQPAPSSSQNQNLYGPPSTSQNHNSYRPSALSTGQNLNSYSPPTQIPSSYEPVSTINELPSQNVYGGGSPSSYGNEANQDFYVPTQQQVNPQQTVQFAHNELMKIHFFEDKLSVYCAVDTAYDKVTWTRYRCPNEVDTQAAGESVAVGQMVTNPDLYAINQYGRNEKYISELLIKQPLTSLTDGVYVCETTITSETSTQSSTAIKDVLIVGGKYMYELCFEKRAANAKRSVQA